jgi:hypothetical protein
LRFRVFRCAGRTQGNVWVEAEAQAAEGKRSQRRSMS